MLLVNERIKKNIKWLWTEPTKTGSKFNLQEICWWETNKILNNFVVVTCKRKPDLLQCKKLQFDVHFGATSIWFESIVSLIKWGAKFHLLRFEITAKSIFKQPSRPERYLVDTVQMFLSIPEAKGTSKAMKATRKYSLELSFDIFVVLFQSGIQPGLRLIVSLGYSFCI